MICIECSTPVSSLYLKYSDSNIRLTRCSNCGKPCDVYIEYDKVLLTIDLILLKPQAFKHLIYNRLIDTTNLRAAAYNRIRQYRAVIRISLLILLFEVYLNWAYEEKNDNASYAAILNCESMLYQYSFFIVQAVINNTIFHLTIQVLLRYFKIIKNNYDVIEFNDQGGFKRIQVNKLGEPLLRTKKTLHYHPITMIASTVILLSSIIKLIPVLIIIWPYDGSTLQLIMLLIKITNNYFVFTLLQSCLGGSTKELIIILAVGNFLSFSISEYAILAFINFICT